MDSCTEIRRVVEALEAIHIVELPDPAVALLADCLERLMTLFPSSDLRLVRHLEPEAHL